MTPIKGLSQRGFSIVEALVATAVLFVITASLGYWITGNATRARMVTDQEGCSQLVTSLVSQIKAHDNSLIVRTYLPPTGNTALAGTPTNNPAEPFCNNDKKMCDTLSLMTRGASGNEFHTYENIRGATTWALTLYNKEPGQYCSQPYGRLFTKESLGQIEKLLPGEMRIPIWVEGFYLKLKPIGINTCPAMVQMGPGKQVTGFQATVIAQYLRPQATGRTAEDFASCSASTNLFYPQETLPPVIISSKGDGKVVVSDAKGEDVMQLPAPHCICPYGWNSADWAGCNPAKVTAKFGSKNPGVMFVCSLNNPDPSQASYCGALGTMTVAGAPDGMLYNRAPTDVTLTMDLPTDNSYTLHVWAVSAGGVVTKAETVDFATKKASCNPVPGCGTADDGCGGETCNGYKSCIPDFPGEPGNGCDPGKTCEEMGLFPKPQARPCGLCYCTIGNACSKWMCFDKLGRLCWTPPIPKPNGVTCEPDMFDQHDMVGNTDGSYNCFDPSQGDCVDLCREGKGPKPGPTMPPECDDIFYQNGYYQKCRNCQVVDYNAETPVASCTPTPEPSPEPSPTPSASP